jgi:16S rRNA (uracil1498-N3)-methyltransferase
MARRLFFVDEVRHGRAEIQGEAARHLTRVLRVEPGQRFEISDNQSLYLAEVEAARKERVVFHVVERLEARQSRVEVTLLAALVKFDRFEWMIEKATELGVARIVPVAAERSDKGLAQAARKRSDRWRKILLEASQQARRVVVPELLETVPFAQALGTAAEARLFLDEEPGGIPILAAIGRPLSVALLPGPEGGWSEQEHANAAQWTGVSLGPLVLRAETASLAALSVVMAAAGQDPR